jgi:hypothetical protein
MNKHDEIKNVIESDFLTNNNQKSKIKFDEITGK